MNMQQVLGFLLILSGIRGDLLVSSNFYFSPIRHESKMSYANYPQRSLLVPRHAHESWTPWKRRFDGWNRSLIFCYSYDIHFVERKGDQGEEDRKRVGSHGYYYSLERGLIHHVSCFVKSLISHYQSTHNHIPISIHLRHLTTLQFRSLTPI
jgi:hypothetical protein